MDENIESIMKEYAQITGGDIPKTYIGPEEQGKRIVKFSILKSTNLEYSNSTPTTNSLKK